MGIYILNFLIVYCSSFCATIAAKKRSLMQIRFLHPSTFFLLTAVLSLSLVAGLRYYVGTDYPTYRGLITYFYQSDLGHILTNDSFNDKGFVFMTWLIGRFTDEAQVAFFIYAVIIIVFAVLTIKDYGKPFELSMALYMTGLAYYSSFNGLRQWIACAVLFWGVRYVIKGSWVKYAFLVFLMSFIHLSAVIMMAVYVLVRHTNWKYTSMILTCLFGGAFVLYSGFIGGIFAFLDGSQYGHYSNVLADTSNGANIFRVLVWAIPIAAYLLYKDRFDEAWPEGKYVVRLSFIGFLFAVLALKNASIYRMCMYFDIYNILIIPRIALLFTKESSRLVYFCIFILFFIYSYLIIPVDSNLLPYRYFNIFG